MTNYEKERDEAADKHDTKENTTGYYERRAEDFKAGADWANARAEKRAKVLVDALRRIKNDYAELRHDRDIRDCNFDLQDCRVAAKTSLATYKGESDG